MKKVDLTQGNVLTVLTKLSLPIMATSLLQFTYNLIDMLWVGHLGSNAVASIGSSSFYTGLGYAINSMVIIGCSVKVAHAIGNKNDDEVKKYINSGLILNLFIAILYAMILIFAGRVFIGFLNINNPIVERDSYIYLALNGPTLFFAFFNMLYSKVVGSFGNNKVALKINSIGIIINIVLDPIFIYVFHLGVFGAGIATLIANIVMFLLYRDKNMNFLRYDKKIGVDVRKIKEIISLGLPMSFQRVLFTIINIFLARIIGRFGSDAIAAQKIGLQIESVVYMVVGGLHGAISSYTGQNLGAKKYERIIKGYNISLGIGIIYSIFMAIIFKYCNLPIIKCFIEEKDTIVIASSYLQMVAYSVIFSTTETVSNGLFTGLGMSKIPATISIIFTALRIPMAYYFIGFMGVSGVWMSIALSSVFKGIAAYSMYLIKVRKEYKYVREY